MKRTTRFTNVCTRQITGICAIIKRPPKKRVLNYFALEMVAFVVARRRHRREQRARGRRERIFSTRINLFGMPEEHIF